MATRRFTRQFGSWLAVGVVLVGCGAPDGSISLLNVSNDPTRKLFQEINAAFAEGYRAQTGHTVRVRQSHGASASQARGVIEGLPADVVTLAMWQDIDAIRREGLIAAGWEDRLPNRAHPFYSTIVFVVRKGNPKRIADWPDLVRGAVQVITPNPKTSGNGKLSFLGRVGRVRVRGGSDDDAHAFVRELYARTPVLDSGARGSAVTFAKTMGDVHLTWENEAHLEQREADGALEIVYPPVSIRADCPVALVDDNVRRRKTASAAKAYLDFLYSPAGQEIIATNHYRPIDPEVMARHAAEFHPVKLFGIEAIAADWNAAQARFFASGGVFDQLYERRPKGGQL